MELALQTSKIFGNWRVSVLTEQLIRLEYDANKQFENRLSQMVSNREFPLSRWYYQLADDVLTIQTAKAEIWLDLKQNTVSAKRPNDGQIWHLGDELHNLGGTLRTLDNVDGAVPLEDGIFSREGLAVLEDDTCLFNVDGTICARGTASRDLYLFLYGREFTRGIQDFYKLCGAVPLLPSYALGNWWSRYWPYTQQEYIELMTRFSNENIPFSVAVLDMDWHLTKVPDGCDSWTGFSWNRELIPEPRKLLAFLHKQDLHVTLNLHPAGGIQFFEENYGAACRELGLNADEKCLIPFDFTSAEFRQAYFKCILQPLEADGVDFWWIDWQQGTDSKISNLDPLWLLNYYHFKVATQVANGEKKATAEEAMAVSKDALAKETCNIKEADLRKTRPLILSRYAGIGSHRFPVGFSGDTIASWTSLAFQPYFTATAANVGYSWWSHDIGGHMKGSKDDELALRWLQFGVFSPINRLHSTCNRFAGKEPWNYRADIADIMREFLRLRAELLPYLYAMNYRSHLEGIPLVRPMYHAFPQAEDAYNCPNQYEFGTSLLVAPIISASDSICELASSEVWLPKAVYYDFFTGVRYIGEKKLEMFRPLNEIPVLAKAGSLIPLKTECVQSLVVDAECAETEYVTLRIYPEADGYAAIYADDGSANGLYSKTEFKLDWAKRQLTISKTDDASYLPRKRVYRLCFCSALVEAIKVSFDGQTVNLEASYEPELRASVVCLPAVALSQAITIDFVFVKLMQAEIVQAEVLKLIMRAQISSNLQEKIYSALEKCGFKHWPALPNESIPLKLRQAIEEVLMEDELS